MLLLASLLPWNIVASYSIIIRNKFRQESKRRVATRRAECCGQSSNGITLVSIISWYGSRNEEASRRIWLIERWVRTRSSYQIHSSRFSFCWKRPDVKRLICLVCQQSTWLCRECLGAVLESYFGSYSYRFFLCQWGNFLSKTIRPRGSNAATRLLRVFMFLLDTSSIEARAKAACSHYQNSFVLNSAQP